MKNKKIEHWDDERELGNGIIVTLNYGYSFEHKNHEGVRGFDTVAGAKKAVRECYKCDCEECQAYSEKVIKLQGVDFSSKSAGEQVWFN